MIDRKPWVLPTIDNKEVRREVSKIRQSPIRDQLIPMAASGGDVHQNGFWKTSSTSYQELFRGQGYLTGLFLRGDYRAITVSGSSHVDVRIEIIRKSDSVSWNVYDKYEAYPITSLTEFSVNLETPMGELPLLETLGELCEFRVHLKNRSSGTSALRLNSALRIELA